MIVLLILAIAIIGAILIGTADAYTGGDDRKTCLYVGDAIPEALFRKKLAGWRFVKPPVKYADAVIATGRGMNDKRLYDVRAQIKCRLDLSILSDKVKFHEQVAKYAPHLIARTFEVDDSSTIEPGTPWMIRANWGFGGKASAVATTTAEMQNLRRAFSRPGARIIASEYIIDPMLVDGYKFHLRVYMLAVVTPEARRLDMLKRGLVIPAHEPYVRGDWANAEIHDTHGRDNRNLRIWPRDLPVPLETVADALRTAVEPLMGQIRVYSESPSAYELIGADVMIRADGSPVIIEINNTPGLTWLNGHPDGPQFAEDIVTVICEGALTGATDTYREITMNLISI